MQDSLILSPNKIYKKSYTVTTTVHEATIIPKHYSGGSIPADTGVEARLNLRFTGSNITTEQIRGYIKIKFITTGAGDIMRIYKDPEGQSIIGVRWLEKAIKSIEFECHTNKKFLSSGKDEETVT